jgi:hypothetical protein
MVRSDEIMGEVVRDVDINDIDMNIQHLLDGLREQIRNIDQDAVVPVEECNGIPVEALVAITDVAHASLPSSRVTSPQSSQEESQSSMYSIDLESSAYDIDNSDMDELVNNKRSNEEDEPDNEDEHKSRRRRIDSQTDLGGSRKRRRRVSKKQKK